MGLTREKPVKQNQLGRGCKSNLVTPSPKIKNVKVTIEIRVNPGWWWLLNYYATTLVLGDLTAAENCVK